MTKAEEIAKHVLTQLELLIENSDPDIGFEYSGSDPKEGAELAMEYTLAGSKHRHVLKDKSELYEGTLKIIEAEYAKRWL